MVSHENAGAARPRHTVACALIGAALLSSPCIVALAAPSLSGSPATSVTAAHYYAFQPGASNGGKKLTFSVTNKPSWAQFDSATGRLYGTPLPQTNVGQFANISISASDGGSRAYLAPFSITVLPLPNTPPRISGTPASAAAVGHAYSFQPTASDPNGLRLAFVIANKPAWASFNTATGALSGTPTAANAGTYPNITITVYDGYQKAVLPAFSIAVQSSTAASTPPVTPPAGGSQTVSAATLSWQPPTQTTSGGTLTNLAGYHIYYGTTPNNLSQTVNVTNPGVTRYVIGGLTAATWYFQLTAYDRNGMESPPTGIESFVLD
jgi:Putative Ig domain